LGLLQKCLLATLPRWAPNLQVSNGLKVELISHDPEVVGSYRADPLVHDRISPRLGRFIADGGPQVLGQAANWKVPTLLLYAGADGLVNPAGSRAFALAAPAGVVTARCFEGLYHEIFNEPAAGREPVMQALQQWLDRQFLRV
jgi:alpha-beta hydrolase superfamily lysophospholipase